MLFDINHIFPTNCHRSNHMCPKVLNEAAKILKMINTNDIRIIIRKSTCYLAKEGGCHEEGTACFTFSCNTKGDLLISTLASGL